MSNQVAKGDSAFMRFGQSLADWSEKWFPDAFVFAILAVFIVFVTGMCMGNTPMALAVQFGEGFWGLIPFTMQMVMIIIGGYVVASSPPVYRIVQRLGTLPKTPRAAIGFVAFFSMLTSVLSWGFSLIFSGLLVREAARNIKGVDIRAIGAAAYLGLGATWALGLSSSAALLMTTKGSIPQRLYEISGVIPLTSTIFLWQSMVTLVILIILSVVIAYFSAPNPDKAHTAEEYGATIEPLQIHLEARDRPGDWLEYSPILTIFIFLVGIAYVVYLIRTKGWIHFLDLNTYNFSFIMLGLLLHWRPRSFLKAVASSVRATGGVLIQFPFYGGIYGIIMASGISAALAKVFVTISTQHTFPVLVGIYSAILGLFVPSGGGRWIIEAPYVLSAAKTLGINMGWVVQIYNAAEALPNLVNPFWMLPLMGVLNIRAREMVGYSVLQLVFHLPVVLFLCWLFSRTLNYMPPVFLP